MTTVDILVFGGVTLTEIERDPMDNAIFCMSAMFTVLAKRTK